VTFNNNDFLVMYVNKPIQYTHSLNKKIGGVEELLVGLGT